MVSSQASYLSFFLLVLLWVLPAHANHDALRVDPFNTPPVDTAGQTTAAFATRLREHLDHELAQHLLVYSSGFVSNREACLHATAAGLVSAAFACEAFVPERVNQTAEAITYPAIADDVCWTIISADNDGIAGWTQVGTTAYYVQCEGDTTANQADLPPNSVWLMQVTVTAGAIATVTDLRKRYPEGADHIERFASFAAAVDQYDDAGDPEVTLTLGSVLHVTQNTTCPENVTLHLLRGAALIVDTGVTLTLNCPYVAADGTAFQGPGTVTYTGLQSPHLYSYVVSGCLPVQPLAGLEIAAFACAGFVSEGNSLLPVVQLASSAVTVSGAATTWLALSRSTTSTPSGCGVGNWSRVTDTHYLLCDSTTKPNEPLGGHITVQVGVTAGNISSLRSVATRVVAQQQTIATSYFWSGPTYFAPGGRLTIAAGQTLTFEQCPIAGHQHIFVADGVTTGEVRLATLSAGCAKVPTRWWGTTGVAEDDVTLQLQAAIDALPYSINTQACLELEAGWHQVTTTLNMTRGAGIGGYVGETFEHNHACLTGQGPYLHTTILCETGDTPCIDISGSHFIEIRHLRLGTDRDVNPSTTGILQAAETVANAVHNFRLHNVAITLKDNETANGTLGSIGLLNYGGENSSYGDLYIVANLPILFTTTPTLATTFGGTGLTVASPYVALVASHSNGANTFTGDNTLIRVEQRAPLIALYGVNSLDMSSMYGQEYPGATLGTAGNIGVWLGSENSNLTFKGTAENIATMFKIRGNVNNSTLNVVAAGTGGAVTWFDIETDAATGPPSLLRGITGRFQNADSGSDTAFSTATPTPAVYNPTLGLFHSDLVFRTITAHTLALPPGDLMRNTQNTRIASAAAVSDISINRQKLTLSQIELGSGAGVITTTVAKITLPTALANQNGLAMAAQVDGLLSYGTTDSAGHSARWVDTRWAFVRDATGNDDVDILQSINPTGAEDTLTLGGAPSHVFTASGGPPAVEYEVQATVTTGGGDSTLYWSGAIELRYTTGVAEAPRLRPNE